MNEGSRAITISPPCLRGPRAVGARIHVDPHDVEAMSSTDARALATALLAAANDAERLDEAALPHLRAFLAAIEDQLSPGDLLGVDDDALA